MADQFVALQAEARQTLPEGRVACIHDPLLDEPQRPRNGCLNLLMGMTDLGKLSMGSL